MSSQGTGGPVKGRSRPTRQAAQQHKYADMKVENGYSYDDTPVRIMVANACHERFRR